MEKVVDAFIKLVDSFRAAPVSFLIVLLLTITIYFLYIERSYIESLIPNPKAESTQFQASIQRDLTINTSLQNSRDYLKSNTIIIAQFHNGQYDLTRLPFTKISVTYYSGNPKIDTDTLYSDRPLSSMNYLMLKMWASKEDPVCVASNTKDIKDTEFKKRMEELGNKFVSLCPITNLLNYPIGYLAIGYTFTPKSNEVPNLLSYQRVMTQRIAGYLQDGVAKNGN